MDFRSSHSSFHDFRDRRAFERSPTAMPELSFASHGPLPIASRSTMNTAPPPLPPPPRIHDLENGYDAGWHHANSDSSTYLPPINPNSSLFGGHRRPEAAPQSDPMQIDECEGRQSGAPVSRSPEAQINIEPPPATEGLPSLMSINTNPTGPILSGERDFSLRSVKDSSNAYDQHLLSKIGKPLSPRGSISLGTDTRGSLSALTVPSRCSSNLPSPGPSEGSTLDVKWYNSPQSGGVSPRTKPRWREHIEGRSPSVESNTPSTALDYDQGSLRDIGRRRYRGTTPQREDSISLPSRSNRGSYDHGVFSDIEGEFSTDEPAPPRQFILREPTPPYPDSRQGMKRRASSPPREPMSDERHTLHVATSNGDLSQRRTSGHPFTNTLSVNPNYPISQRTLSAASSLSIRTSGSYSSTLSIGGSSMTSLSPYDQRSPGGLSPSSDLDTYHEKSILNPSSPAALVQPTIARGLPGPASLEPPTTDATGKLSVPTTILNVPKPATSKIGGLFICDCCPKKPKKFDNPDDLRSHEMEKQYACAYCNNRFKNKNEAERHQNSLHLRRHSWSCAALISFQAAFHASGAQSCQTNAGPSHDTCGYCGEEFPNFPSPDWDARFEHLTTVHKYGECNNAKKFFRADHFRQHLKHSHAGTSGKWTNILENACMKEEQPDKPRDQSGSGNGSAGSLSSNAITEVLSEQ